MQISLRSLLVVVAIAAILVAAVVAVLPDDPFSGAEFDRDVWIQFADDYGRDNPRAAMIADLRTEHLPVGMTKHEVLELLGAPESEPTDDIFSYIVGMWSGYRMDHDGLRIYFDANEKLTTTSLVQY